MSKLPKQYAWLAREPGPRILLEGLKTFGTVERPGPSNNPSIMAWAKEIGPDVAKVYSADSIPWCGLFLAVCAKRAGKPLPHSPLWARAWATWGNESKPPVLGDVLVFVRSGGGHVGIYVGETDRFFAVLGGNQSDSVCIKMIQKSRLIASRNLYKIRPPKNVRRVFLSSGGDVSNKED